MISRSRIVGATIVLAALGFSNDLSARWATPDPLYLEQPEMCLKDAASCNLYSYVRNNPALFVDPTGTDAVVLHGGFVGGPGGVEGLGQRVRQLFTPGAPSSIPEHRPKIDYDGAITNDGPLPGARIAEQHQHKASPKILAGFSVGGDAALRAGAPRDGGTWNLRVVAGAKIVTNFVELVERAAATSDMMILVGIRGDTNLKNDAGVPGFVGNRFGDRSYEGMVSAIESRYGSLEGFYTAFPNVSIQAAEGAHGGGGNRESTLDAVSKGFQELWNR